MIIQKSPVPPSRDVFYRSRYYTLIELEKIKEIYSGKYPIVLVKEKSSQEKYALKVFPYLGGHIPSNYHNEMKFIKYKHPNVLEILSGSEDYHSTKNGIRSKACYILMEFAPYNDFHTMVIEKGVQFDELLARTYFHQLIAGIEYLHQNGVYHLDLKLENLLLGQAFQLKIADFDLSYIKNEGKIVSKGTKDYRPPEIINSTCMDPAAADVYSAGVLLFIFVTNGFLPYSEGKKSEAS
jgi:serine/threonine protein kinase